MRLGKELIGKPVISLSDGRNLGAVKDIYLDENLYWMAGIYLGSEGLFSRKARLIAGDNISLYGVDVILVKNSDVVTKEGDWPPAADWIRLDKLKGREVDTPGGTKVGTIGDVYFDEEGRVTDFALARAFVEGPIAAKGSVPRNVLIDTGNKDGAMTIDLAKAEREGEHGNQENG